MSSSKNHSSVEGVGLKNSMKVVKVAGDVEDPSRTPAQISWAPSSKFVRISTTAHFRSAASLSLIPAVPEPVLNDAEFDAQVVAVQQSDEMETSALRNFLSFIIKQPKVFGRRIYLRFGFGNCPACE